MADTSSKSPDEFEAAANRLESNISDRIKAAYKQGETAGKNLVSGPSPVVEWVKEYGVSLLKYFPNSIVLFGVITDVIHQEFRYTIASLIGICSIFLSWGLGKLIGMFTFATDLPPGGCTVPGFEWFESTFSPQGIVLPVAVFFYILCDIWNTRGFSESGGTIGLVSLLIVAHVGLLYSNNCFGGYYFSAWLTILSGLVVGIVSGSIGWGVVKNLYPSKLPSASSTVPDTPPSQSPYATSGGKNPLASPSVGTCSAANDDDQMVCEAYKNGELVTNSISA